MEPPRPEEHELQQQVRQDVERIKQARQDQGTLLGQTVYLGSIGVMLALPIVVGAYLGSWLDSLSHGYRVHWTVSLILLGIVVGMVNVYLFIKE